uniref:Elongin-C n=1 Tax=Strigamia maritima TaxID=126957 RepID=T1J331_STRMM
MSNSECVVNCDGLDHSHVKLISSDEREFIIKREHALLSGTIRGMLMEQGLWNQVKFSQISGAVLKIVCDYLAYRAQYVNGKRELPSFYLPLEISPERLSRFLDM